MTPQEIGPAAFARWLIDRREKLRQEGKINTQESIARKAGVSRSTVAMIEMMARPGAAIHQPRRDVVTRLAKAVEGSTSEALYIAGWATNEQSPADDWPEPVKEVAEELRRMPADRFELVRKLVDQMKDPNRVRFGAGVASV